MRLNVLLPSDNMRRGGETAETPKIGEIWKVHLPGEAPWAEVIKVENADVWYGRIDNDLIASDLHRWKCDDIVKFGRDPNFPEFPNAWIPVETEGERVIRLIDNLIIAAQYHNMPEMLASARAALIKHVGVKE